MNLFASIYERETRGVLLYTFLRGIRLTTAEMRWCGTHTNASHWACPIYHGGESMLFSIVAGMRI